ncbi:MAG: hypothetical protein R6U64_01030 [Bacteroidales bacterium]
MHKHRLTGAGVVGRDLFPAEDNNRISEVLLLAFALCLMNFYQYPVQNQMGFSLFFFIISFFSGFVIVSGDTVMAAQNFVFLQKKIEKLKNNINQLQLTGGHFPGAILPNQPSSPFLVLLWFPSGNPFPGLPVFCCPQFYQPAFIKKEGFRPQGFGIQERRRYAE